MCWVLCAWSVFIVCCVCDVRVVRLFVMCLGVLGFVVLVV